MWIEEEKKGERFKSTDVRGAGGDVLICSLCDDGVDRYIVRTDQPPVMCKDCHRVFCKECIDKRIYSNDRGEGHKCPNCKRGRRTEESKKEENKKDAQRDIIWFQYREFNSYLKRILNNLVVRCKQPIGDDKICGKAYKLNKRKKHYRRKCSRFIYYECTAKICRIRS